MGGTNPYIPAPKTEQAQQKYTITFLPSGKMVEVDPQAGALSGTGLPGSILDIALAHDIDIDHACGGVCACSTCHVIVQEGLSTCNESTDEEGDQLDKAPGVTSQSRLSCQCVPNGTQNLKVFIPSWNRNQVRE